MSAAFALAGPRHPPQPAFPPPPGPAEDIRAALARDGVLLHRGGADPLRALAAAFGPLPQATRAGPGCRQGRTLGGGLARFLVAEADGGAIVLADQQAAHDRLDPWLREQLVFLAWHPSGDPLVVLDPATGRRALHPGTGMIAGLPPEDAARLKPRLEAAACDPAVTRRHELRPGDVLVWDNHRFLHRPAAGGRVLVRAIAGPAPVGVRDVATAWVSAG